MENLQSMIGIDIVSVSRIKEVYDKHQDRFLKKFLTQDEISYINNIESYIVKLKTITTFFSIKESMYKCGFNPKSFTILKINSRYKIQGNDDIYISTTNDNGMIISVVFVNNRHNLFF